MKRICALILTWVFLALSAAAHAQIQLYEPPLLPPRVTAPVEPEKAQPEPKLMVSDLLPREPTWVPCLPTINGIAGTAQGFTVESTYQVSAKKMERLIEAVCISLSAELALSNSTPDTVEELRKLPVILVPVYENNTIAAMYDSNLDVIVLADGFLNPSVSMPALIFALTHELAHRQNKTMAKKKSIQVSGAAAVVAGAVTVLNPWRKAALAKKGVKAIGAATAVVGGTAFVCPAEFWDNEISADKYAARALFAFYRKKQSISVAQQTVFAAARSLMKHSPSDKDDDCLNLTKKPNGDKDLSINDNPHPGPRTRLKYIGQALNLD